MAMDMGPRTRAAILSLLLLATAAGCGEAAAARRNFVLAQQYRKQALAANERGDSARATQYLQQAQMHEPVGEQASLPPSTTMLLPQHRAIAPASGPVTCHTIGINRFSCF